MRTSAADIDAQQEADDVRNWIPRVVLGAGMFLPAAASAQAAHAKVKIVAPANGATVSAPVKVVLQATGVEIVPATVERPGTGHHHLFVDHDLTPVDDTIPRGVTGILHLGRGQTEFVLDSLKPGPHRVIAVVADWKHIPLKPLVVDTVRFTVK
jgi:uncharacterized protein DUF4399